MIKICYFVFSFILVVKTISDSETDRKLNVDGPRLSDESSKSNLGEIATDLTTILNNNNKESDRLERSPVQLRDESNSETESQESYKRGDASIPDFDDYETESRSADDDFVDEERIDKELENEKNSKIGKKEPPVLIDSRTRKGDDNLKTEIDNADWSRGSSDESSESGYTRRRLSNPTNKFGRDSTLFGTLPNLFPIYNNNFGQFLNPPYSSTTAYNPSTNWFNAVPFNQFPKAQIPNPYNFNDFKNSYDTSNKYPYMGNMGHINTAPMPLLPHNFYANIRPQDYTGSMAGPNSYGSSYSSTNFGAQQLDHRRLVRNMDGF